MFEGTGPGGGSVGFGFQFPSGVFEAVVVAAQRVEVFDQGRSPLGVVDAVVDVGAGGGHAAPGEHTSGRAGLHVAALRGGGSPLGVPSQRTAPLSGWVTQPTAAIHRAAATRRAMSAITGPYPGISPGRSIICARVARSTRRSMTPRRPEPSPQSTRSKNTSART